MNEYRGIKYSYRYNVERFRYDIFFQVNGDSYKISYASELSIKFEAFIEILCMEAINFVKWYEDIEK